MDNLKILIVEDERLTAMDIQEQLLEFGYADTFIAGDSSTAIQLFTSQAIDFILMDIQLNGSSIDGIALVEIFNNIRKVPVIYLTSHDEEATIQRAKKTKPINYLLKDYIKQQLNIAIDIAIDAFLAENDMERNSAFIKTDKSYSKKLLTNKISFHKLNGILEIVAVEDIVYCEADGTITKVFLKGYKQNERNIDIPTFTAMRNLGFYATRLENDASFFRVKSDILLNLTYLKTYNHGERTLLLTNNRSLLASREGGKKLNSYLTDY
jgi:CheY-like chemotaxis protein